MQEDLVAVVLRERLPRGARQRVENEHADHVRTTRRCFQDAMRAEISRGVEELTGRRVIASSGTSSSRTARSSSSLLQPRAHEAAPETGRRDPR